MGIARFTLAAAFGLFAAGAASAASPPELIARGEYLARAGNCVSCHSTPDGEPFAGGLKMAVPFLGAIYTTNITPDKEHGIGAYTFEDFEGAMRRGVAMPVVSAIPVSSAPASSAASIKDIT